MDDVSATSMPLIHATGELESAQVIATVLNHNGIPSYVVRQDCLGALGVAIPNAYCVHIAAEGDRSRATAVLFTLGTTPVYARSATRLRLAVTFVALALTLAALSWV
jgi:hypothetical protein